MIGIILKLGGIQSLLVGAILLNKRSSNRANIFLSILLFALGISCILYSFNSLEYYIKYPHLIRVDWGIPLLFGPLIYLYTLVLTSNERSIKKRLVHLAPYLINLLILVPFFLKKAEEKIQILDYFTATITGGTDGYHTYNILLRFSISAIGLFYSLSSIKVLRIYSNKLLDEYSAIEKLKLDWLRNVLYSFLILSVVFILTSFITFRDPYPQFDYNVYYFLLVSILVYALSYKALNQPALITLVGKANETKTKLTAGTEDTLGHQQHLKSFMVDQKPYLNGELTATKLDEDLNMSRHQLSTLLNEVIGLSFYDFINNYRIEEFKERMKLSENNHLTMFGIALDSGFNSKTSFNTIFKKATGQTPSQYKKSQE